MMCILMHCMLTKMTSARRILSMLLNLAGREAIQREKTTYATGESKENPETLKTKFGEICKPKTNLTMERHAFNTRVQEQGELVKAFKADLKLKAATCKFGTLKDEMIRDRLVVGIRTDSVRKLLLREDTCQMYPDM